MGAGPKVQNDVMKNANKYTAAANEQSTKD